MFRFTPEVATRIQKASRAPMERRKAVEMAREWLSDDDFMAWKVAEHQEKEDELKKLVGFAKVQDAVVIEKV